MEILLLSLLLSLFMLLSIINFWQIHCIRMNIIELMRFLEFKYLEDEDKES